jgi:hypothetical protein
LPAAANPARDALSGGQTLGVLLETLDAKELRTNRIFRVASEARRRPPEGSQCRLLHSPGGRETTLSRAIARAIAGKSASVWEDTDVAG